MKHLSFLFAMILACALPCQSKPLVNIDYTKVDSLKVVDILAKATQRKTRESWMLYFGRQFCGVPYVAKTLENNEKEHLVVNLRQFDCTTFVETTLALTLCAENKKYRFADFCHYLRLVRYRHGNVSYTDRLHYFTQWIDDNTELGFVREITSRHAPFNGLQVLNINFMTTHVNLYPMLVGNSVEIEKIRKGEQQLYGRKFRYIPKSSISNTPAMRRIIHDGDIIVILTSKKGLDTSHIGIAEWKQDGLHLLNASSLRHKVVSEPKLLRTYMMGQKSQTGIRIARVL